MNDKSELIVSGYCFGTAEDAETARQELKKIEYLEEHMDYKRLENMLLVYNKAVEGRIFRTPIGWEYLRKLQSVLASDENIQEQVMPIPMYTVFAHRIGDEIRVPEPRIQPKKINPFKKYFAVSFLVNIMLAAAVAGMFAIAVTSDNPNVLNYENALINRYAAWEQELSEREAVVKEKEAELHIEE